MKTVFNVMNNGMASASVGYNCEHGLCPCYRKNCIRGRCRLFGHIREDIKQITGEEPVAIADESNALLRNPLLDKINKRTIRYGSISFDEKGLLIEVYGERYAEWRNGSNGWWIPTDLLIFNIYATDDRIPNDIASRVYDRLLLEEYNKISMTPEYKRFDNNLRLKELLEARASERSRGSDDSVPY